MQCAWMDYSACVHSWHFHTPLRLAEDTMTDEFKLVTLFKERT